MSVLCFVWAFSPVTNITSPIVEPCLTLAFKIPTNETCA